MIVIAVFAVLLLLGVPIFAVLIATGTTGIELFTNVKAMIIPLQFYNGIDQQTLLAVPFFIVAGTLASKGKTSENLVKVMNILFGRLRGGSVIAGLAACAFFAAISGSSMATVVAIGAIIIPSLRKTDYPEQLTVGSIAAGGSLGILIPPSAPMVMFCVAMECSVGRMFMAGFVPGILLAVFWGIYVYVYCRKNNCGSPVKISAKESGKILVTSIPAILFPVIILGSIYTGWATPTEAAAISVVYVMLVETFIYKTVKFRNFAKQFFDSLVTSSTLLSIIAAAAVLSYFITLKRIPDLAVAFISSFVSSSGMLLVFVLLFLFIAGCFVDTISLIVVLAPILVPVLRSYHVDLIHFGILAVLCSQIGYMSPPFGTNLFVTMRVADKSFGYVSRSIVPFIIIILVFTVALAFCPQIVMFLPNTMM
ncbi:MAG: TRAP transporter large permease subunit [Clostridiales bacterium]|nr:TRAP transporter large permease subunit [Clostridiales bacterium]